MEHRRAGNLTCLELAGLWPGGQVHERQRPLEALGEHSEGVVPSGKGCKGSPKADEVTPGRLVSESSSRSRARRAEERKHRADLAAWSAYRWSPVCLVGMAGHGRSKAGRHPHGLRPSSFLVRGDAFIPSDRGEGCPQPTTTTLTCKLSVPAKRSPWKGGKDW